MRNTFKIFGRDIKSLFHHFFALAVALVITFLPSLYAWLNIYSNWDPYGNTGNISIAVASMDKGYTDDGEYINKGKEVVEDLKSSTAINWVILDNEQAAVDGVYSGDYYAAVVIDENFTYNMYNMLTEWVGKPSITYYENAKKNAVATKITDTAVESLKRSISENYLDVLISSFMKTANQISADLESSDPEGSVKGVIGQTRNLLAACLSTMDAFSAANDLKSQNGLGIDPLKLAELISQINLTLPEGSDLHESVAKIDLAVYEALGKVQDALDRCQQAVGNDELLADAQKVTAEAAVLVGKLGDHMLEWSASFPDNNELAAATKELAQHMADNCFELQSHLERINGSDDMSSIIFDCSDIAQDIFILAGSFVPTAEDMQHEISNVLINAANTLDCMRGLAGDAAKLRDAAADALVSLDTLMNKVHPVLLKMTASLYDKIYKLSTLDGEEYLQTLIDILGGSPELYGEFFSQMVQTSVTQVYPIENYGSAMTPFYSVLAIWVGGVMLAAIIKTHASTDGIDSPRPAQLFFGRYLLFFVLSQLQTLIIILGDLYILKIQCLHPGLLLLTGFVTSFTFSLLIYSLAVSFGDVGKAIVVVIMVLQIAGSSGTFPIELLPYTYQKVYRFSPSPMQ